MPKVRILQAVAGASFTWGPGEVVDMSESEAAKWADGSRGERVDKPERAAKQSRGGGREPKMEQRRASDTE